MRIVMACPDTHPIDRRIFLQAKTLISAGHEVVIFADPAEGKPDVGIEDGIKVVRLRLPTGWLDRRWTGLKKGIKKAFLGGSDGRRGGRSCAASRTPSTTSAAESSGFPAGGIPTRRPITTTMRRWLGNHLTSSYQALKSLFLISVRARQKRNGLLFEGILKERPDCVHAHDLPVLPAAVRAGKHLRIPIVYDCHEFYPEQEILHKKEREYWRELEKELMPSADLVYTVNDGLAALMRERYQRPIHTIWNATDPPPGFQPRAGHDRFRELLGIPSGQRILLYQGGFARDRGLESLVAGMRHVDRSIVLVLLGYGEYRSILEDIAAREGLLGRMYFVPAVPQNELLFWTASADAGVIPYPPVDANSQYCSPNKSFEFIQSELPFLANDLPFFNSVVQKYPFALLRDLTTPQAAGKAINEMFSDPARLARMRDLMALVRDEFTWARQGKRLLDMFAEAGVMLRSRRFAA